MWHVPLACSREQWHRAKLSTKKAERFGLAVQRKTWKMDFSGPPAGPLWSAQLATRCPCNPPYHNRTHSAPLQGDQSQTPSSYIPRSKCGKSGKKKSSPEPHMIPCGPVTYKMQDNSFIPNTTTPAAPHPPKYSGG